MRSEESDSGESLSANLSVLTPTRCNIAGRRSETELLLSLPIDRPRLIPIEPPPASRASEAGSGMAVEVVTTKAPLVPSVNLAMV